MPIMKHTCCALLAAASILLGSTLAQDEPQPEAPFLPVVNLGYELHRAISFNEIGGYYNFSNIRYAAPPVGDLRWRAPVAPKVDRTTVQTGEKAVTCPSAPVWWGDVANRFVSAYLQGIPFIPPPRPQYSDDQLTQQPNSSTEDCLFLDVFSPKKVFDDAGKVTGAPVMVWLHGGGFAVSSKTDGVTPSGLLRRAAENSDDSLVFVAINYRIGAFGFLGGPTLQQDGIANAGLYDQRFALNWVRRNIHLFGGDPNRVTVMGDSAGGGSIVHQITAYGGKDLGKTPFQRAIIQSPGFYPQPSSQKQEAIFNQFLTTAKVKSLKEARALDSKSLIAANALQIGHYALYGQFIYGPTVDGVFAPSLPGKLLASGLFDKTIKVMTSYTTREGLIFTDPSIQDNSALEAYLRANFPQASAISLKYIVEVLYPPIFDGSQPYTDQSGRVSLLIAEMTFVCNTFYTHKAFLNDTYAFQFGIAPGLHAGDLPYTFYQDAAASPAVSNITAALAIQNFETTFAQTGAPKWKGLMSFPQYGAGANIVNITQSRIYKTRDPAANSRCDWWQQGLLF